MPIKMAKGRVKSTRRRVTLSSMPEAGREGERERGKEKERELVQ